MICVGTGELVPLHRILKNEMLMAYRWIRTEQMLDDVREHPNEDRQYTYLVGAGLVSTHWLMYDAERDLYGDSVDWFEYAWYTREEFLAGRGERWWSLDHG